MTDDYASHIATLSLEDARGLEQLIADGKVVHALKRVRALLPSIPFPDAVTMVLRRMQEVGVDFSPPPPPTDELRRMIDGLDGRLLALEAMWDGDTFNDWFVVLVAIVASPSAERGVTERHLATFLQKHGDPATSAIEVGRALASEHGVPFFFASPDSPDDRAPRWWDSEKS